MLFDDVDENNSVSWINNVRKDAASILQEYKPHFLDIIHRIKKESGVENLCEMNEKEVIQMKMMVQYEFMKTNEFPEFISALTNDVNKALSEEIQTTTQTTKVRSKANEELEHVETVVQNVLLAKQQRRELLHERQLLLLTNGYLGHHKTRALIWQQILDRDTIQYASPSLEEILVYFNSADGNNDDILISNKHLSIISQFRALIFNHDHMQPSSTSDSHSIDNLRSLSAVKAILSFYFSNLRDTTASTTTTTSHQHVYYITYVICYVFVAVSRHMIGTAVTPLTLHSSNENELDVTTLIRRFNKIQGLIKAFRKQIISTHNIENNRKYFNDDMNEELLYSLALVDKIVPYLSKINASVYKKLNRKIVKSSEARIRLGQWLNNCCKTLFCGYVPFETAIHVYDVCLLSQFTLLPAIAACILAASRNNYDSIVNISVTQLKSDMEQYFMEDWRRFKHNMDVHIWFKLFHPV